MSILRFFRGDTLYIQVFQNRFRVRNVSQDKTLDLMSPEPFSHPRTVLATYSVAENLLRNRAREIRGMIQPSVLIHPMEKIEGGLTQIEERAFLELGYGFGAAKVGVWTGKELKDEEVMGKLTERRRGQR